MPMRPIFIATMATALTVSALTLVGVSWAAGQPAGDNYVVAQASDSSSGKSSSGIRGRFRRWFGRNESPTPTTTSTPYQTAAPVTVSPYAPSTPVAVPQPQQRAGLGDGFQPMPVGPADHR